MLQLKSLSRLWVLVMSIAVMNSVFASDDPKADLVSLLDVQNEAEIENCIYARDIRTVEVLDERGLVIRGSHDRFWVNQFVHKCAGLQKNMVLNFKRYGSQICANDRVAAQDRATDGFGAIASCRLGKFQPVVMEQIATLKAELGGAQ
ncbi:MAG: hypothetical protein AAF541_14770 [Pseudomonadota bacterium]